MNLLLDLGFVQRKYFRKSDGSSVWQLTDSGRAAMRPKAASGHGN